MQRTKVATSLQTLTKLLSQAQNTRYGRHLGFSKILTKKDTYSTFCRQVPVTDYESLLDWLSLDKKTLKQSDLRPLVNEMWPGRIDVFSLTSGTTSGRTKYIPYSKMMMAANYRAALDLFAHILSYDPNLAPPWRRTLYMSGSTLLKRNEQGILCGDLSALARFLTPRLWQWVALPPQHIASMEPWSKRLEALAKLCIQHPEIGILSGVPVWQLSLLEAVQRLSNKPLADVMPNLRVIIHGGMSVEPYRDKLKELADENTLFIDIYASSEAGVTAFQLPGSQGMHFFEHYGSFYEFEDEHGNITTSCDLVPGKIYNLIISCCSGLWRYRIGDQVVFHSVRPLVLDYVSRSQTMSAFDEKITEKQLEIVMSASQPYIRDFSVGPLISQKRHIYFLVTDYPLTKTWLIKLDNHLRKINQDYDDYRSDGRINLPGMVRVHRSSFLKQIGRSEGGQNKVPRLLSPKEVETLLSIYEIDKGDKLTTL
ncbi:MAG: GH3 auxin-responsive promoter family protein [bacterium]|nr:MAG: GH3 auxin-responsive promoter family protein [bacterium]